jgi:hypothetical protein
VKSLIKRPVLFNNFFSKPYLSIAIQQTSPLADRVNRSSSPGINKIEQTVKTIQKQLKQEHSVQLD